MISKNWDADRIQGIIIDKKTTTILDTFFCVNLTEYSKIYAEVRRLYEGLDIAIYKIPVMLDGNISLETILKLRDNILEGAN